MSVSDSTHWHFCKLAIDFCVAHRITRQETIEDLAELLAKTASEEAEYRVLGVTSDLRAMADRLDGER